MKIRTLPFLVSLLFIGLFLALPRSSAAADRSTSVDRYIIVFHADVSPAAATADLARAHKLNVSNVYSNAIKGMAATVPAGRLDALQNDPRVAYVEADQQVSLLNQTNPTGIRRIFADSNPNLDIDGSDDVRVDVDVAIIDTGIDLQHVDLNVVASTDCSGGGPFNQSCGDGGDDDNGHGTHVAGTVAAVDNGTGVVGVAPGARLWAVKVLDSQGSGYISWIVAGIDYVTANADQIDVANMSLGCECSSDAMDTAITNSVAAGVTYAVAAGNSDADSSTFSPANHPDVITVSALADFDGEPGALGSPTCRTDEDDTLANFSNWGADVEIAAPGVCILSTWHDGGYNTISGTSMASPHVAGAAAVLAASGNYSPDQIRSKLIVEGNLDWTDDSGDGIQEPLLDVSNTTVFNPATVPGGGDGGGDGGGGQISLSATAYKVKGVQHVDLEWSGATSTNVDIHRNGTIITTTANDGFHTDNIGQKGGGSYTYKVCEAGTTTCSAEVTVNF